MPNMLLKSGVFLLIVSAVFTFFSAVHAAEASAVQLVASGEGYVEFRLSPLWESDTCAVGDETLHHLSFQGAEWTGQTGAAALPGRTITLAVPLQGQVTAQVVDAPFEEQKTLPLVPVATVRPGQDEQFLRDAVWYSRDQFFPEQTVTVSEPLWFRQQRIVRVFVGPVQYNPRQGRLRRYGHVQVRISFPSSAASRPVRGAADEELYRAALLNYEQGRAWRSDTPSALSKTGSRLDTNNWYKIIIRGDGKGGKEGVYKVDGAALQKANVPIASIDPTTVQLFNNGGRELPQSVSVSRPDSMIENPIQLVGTEDGKLDSGDYLLFYGRSLEGNAYDATLKRRTHYIHRYGYDNVYWLTFGKKKGLRIADKAAVPATGVPVETSFRDLAFVEEEKTIYLKSGTEWFGAGLSTEQRTFSQTFSLPGAVPADTTLYRVQMAAASAGTHQFRLSANGNTLGDMSLVRDVYGYTTRIAQFIAPGTLMDGNNTVSVTYLSNSDIMLSYVDWIEVEYGRRFLAQGDQLLFNAPVREGVAGFKIDAFSRDDITVWEVTDFHAVRKITGTVVVNKTVAFADRITAVAPRRYLAFTPAAYRTVTEIVAATRNDLRTPRDVDYIIITYDDFYQQAMQLKSLRENWSPNDRLSTEVVRISDVINEFGWGISDPTAIRDFLLSAYQRWSQPRYVLLLGDGHYDYKNILKHGVVNFIPPYETADRSENDTRVTDDWFTYLKGNRSGMQMAIGRMPVQSVEEAQAAVDKTIAYETNYEPGEWRKTITIVGDDELKAGGVGQETDHTRQAEILAESHVPDLFNVRKIYLMDYPVVRTVSVSGVTKPQANEALIDQINQGTLILNFIGHGNDELWTHEQVLYAPTDFHRIQNQRRLPLWVAATCEFAYWDQPDKQSFAERIQNAAERGAIAMVASSRVAFSYDNASFNYQLFDILFNPYVAGGKILRIGDAVMIAKNNTYNDYNSEKYAVLGDPALRLGAPTSRAKIERITPDSLQALRRVRVSGYIEKDAGVWNDFNGKLLLRVVDAKRQRIYETSAGLKVYYVLPGNSVFRGVTEINNGRFNMEFIVPKDISYGGEDGRLSLYFWNDASEGTGHYEKLPVGGTAVNLIDHDGPEIAIKFGQEDFASGDFTKPDPLLNVEISDSLSGVNIAGDIGHQISMVLDDDQAAAKDMTQFFEYHSGSFTSGVLKYQLTGLTQGLHTLQIKAWDNSNNSSMVETVFQVVADSVLTVRNLLNSPNPMTAHTQFSFELSNEARVTLKIFSVAGRLLKKFEPMLATVGFNQISESWDGRDEDGDLLANGVYLYRLEAVRENAKVEKIGKVVIAR